MAKKLGIVGLAVVVLMLAVGGVVWAAETARPGLPQGRLAQYVVRGVVTAVDNEEVSVETADGSSATLFLDDATHFWMPGEPPTTTMQLAVGDPVLALGKPTPSEAGDKALLAQLVVVADDEELPKILIRGRAVAVTRQTIVVQTGQRERAITVTRNTRLLSTGGRLDSLREVHPGDQIIALGQPTEFGQWVAGLVLLPDATPLARFGLRGTVSAKDEAAGTLIVETEQRGEITVVTDDETRYRIPGVAEPGFDDLRVGDRIAALGRFEEGSRTRFLARGIGVTPLQDETERP